MTVNIIVKKNYNNINNKNIRIVDEKTLMLILTNYNNKMNKTLRILKNILQELFLTFKLIYK